MCHSSYVTESRMIAIYGFILNAALHIGQIVYI